MESLLRLGKRIASFGMLPLSPMENWSSHVGDSAAMKRRYPDAESVDCSGKIILPGFICAHHHFYSTMARGMAIPGEPAKNFVEILEKLWWKVDRALG